MAQPAPPAALGLSLEQKEAYMEVLTAMTSRGGSIFITGKAGTGKSTLLKAIRDDLNLPVLAPTGLAAVSIGGQTIHSFFGLRPGDTTREKVKPMSLRVLRQVPGILIDEISMVRADLLDHIDRMCRNSLQNDLPFGGKTVIMFGDPWQIEPVVSSYEERSFLQYHYDSPFFFDSNVYMKAQVPVIELTEVFRQSEDPDFRDALNKIREGDLSDLDLINERSVESPELDTLRLTFTNQKAFSINNYRLQGIGGGPKTYEGFLKGEFNRELPVEDRLTLKPGARVMVVANKRPEYYNGDLATVTRLYEAEVVVQLDRTGEEVTITPFTWEKLVYSWDSGTGLTAEPVAEYTQIPLKLAWAATVHKCQGQTLDQSHLEFERQPFAHGQTYVALSRCRTLEGLSMARKLTERDIVFNPRVLEWFRTTF